MKTTKFFKLVWLFVLALTFNACVDDNDYTVPTIEVQDPNLTATNTIQSVLDMYENSVVDFNTIGEGLIIEGYVVSSDESGNIYKTINIQDKPKDPTAAVQLAVDATDLYTFYEVGRKVYVKLNGLGLHNSNGVLEIGQLDGTSVERIASTDYKNHIVRSTETATIMPLIIDSIEDITDANISMLVQLNDMRSQEKDVTYANTDNTYSVNRTFGSCSSAGTIIMRNSGFATFKAQQIPMKRGSIVAVLGKYRRDYQLFIRDTDDVNFKQDYDCSSNATLKTIADIKELYTGEETTITDDIKIKAVITSDLSKDNISNRNAFVQDATAGIALRFSDAYDLNLGDEIEIYVRNLKLSEFRGLLQLNLSPSDILNTTEGTLPEPEVITIEQALTGDYEGKLVKIEGVQFKDITKTYSGSNLLTSDCTDELTTFVRSGASFADTQVSGKKGTVTGVMSEYNSPQIYLRDVTDVDFTEDYGCVAANLTEKTVTDLRALFTGSTTTVTEDAKIKVVVTSDASTGNINGRNAFVQDATAGIALRFDADHSLKLGEEVEISIKDATLSEYKGLLQLNVTSANVLSQVTGTLPTPKTITVADALTGNYEAQLVKIEGVQFKDITKTYSGGNELTSDCSDALTVYVGGGATFKDTQVSDKKGAITGVMSEFDTPQLYIRDTSDVNFTENYVDCASGTQAEKTVTDLRALFAGSTTTVTEDAKIKVVVTSDASTGNINGRNAFVQDATAGIALRFDADHSLKLGEEVEISIKDATLSEYKGLLQLNVTSANVLSQVTGTLPTPKTITMADALTGNYEAQLVQIGGVQFKDITKTYSGSNELTSDCSDSLTVYVNGGASFAGTQVDDKKGAITGVMSEVDTPQLYIRDTNDVNFTDAYVCGSIGGGSTATIDTVFFSELADPNNNANARFIELYNSGTEAIDLTGWVIRRYTNEKTSSTSSIDLSGQTIAAGSTFVIAKNATEFSTVYGVTADMESTSAAADSNGDDQLELVDPNGTVIDIFGVIGEDGSGTNHEFEDGRAYRKASVTKGNSTYTFAEWDIWNDTGSAGTTNAPQDAPGAFTPKVR